MIVKGNSGSVEFEQPPAGTHIARCVRLIDIGSQVNPFREGSMRRQVVVAWELPEELMTEGENKGHPFMCSKFYTMSLHEKASLRQDLVNWRGRDFTEAELEGFDLRTILGHLCQVVLTLSDKGKARVTGLASVPRSLDKTAPALAQVNPSIYLSLEPEEFDAEVFASLSDGYRRMIEESPEYAMLMHQLKGDEYADMKKEDAKEPDGEDLAAQIAEEFDAEVIEDDESDIPF